MMSIEITSEKMLDEYLRKKGGTRADLRDTTTIIEDEPDSFMVSYPNSRGEPVVMGYERCEFTFWRNRAEGI